MGMTAQWDATGCELRQRTARFQHRGRQAGRERAGEKDGKGHKTHKLWQETRYANVHTMTQALRLLLR